MENLLTVGVVARRLKKSPGTIIRYIVTGALPAVRLGRTYHIAESDLAAFLDRSRVVPSPETAGFRTAVEHFEHERAGRICQELGT